MNTDAMMPPLGEDGFHLNGIPFYRKTKNGSFYASIPTANGRREINTGIHDADEAKACINIDVIMAAVRNDPAGNVTARILNELSKPQITLVDAVGMYIDHITRYTRLSKITIRDYRSTLNKLLQAMPMDAMLGDVSHDVIDKIINGNSSHRLATRTTHLTGIRLFFNWALNEGHVTSNPASKVYVRERDLPLKLKGRRYTQPWNDAYTPIVMRWIEDERLRCLARYDEALAEGRAHQSRRLLRRAQKSYQTACALGEMKYVFMFCRYLGLRIRDAVSIEWAGVIPSELNENGKYILLYTHKRCRQIRIEPPPFIRQSLQELARTVSHDQPYVLPVLHDIFHNRTTTFSCLVARIYRACNVKVDKRFHSMRVSFALDCLNAGMSMDEVARAMAHSSVATTVDHYLGRGLEIKTPYRDMPIQVDAAFQQPLQQIQAQKQAC